MQSVEVGTVVAFLTLFALVISNVFSARATLRKTSLELDAAREERREQREREEKERRELREKSLQEQQSHLKETRVERLMVVVRVLVQARSELQFLQDKGTNLDQGNYSLVDMINWEREREVWYGRAYAEMMFAGDSDIRSLAADVMEKKTASEKLAAIDEAIVRLRALVDDLLK